MASWSDTSPKVGKAYAKAAKKKAEEKSSYTGFKKKSGQLYYYRNGKKLKSKWLTKNGKTYYFGKDGKAAAGSVKAKRKGVSAYWVFSAKHVLLTGSKTRTVKVSGVTYRVGKNGQAKPGWAKSHTVLYLPNGEMARGYCLVKGKVLSFSSKGAYNAALSKRLQKLCVVNSDPAQLLAAMGKPDSVKTYANSCYSVDDKTGSDIVYVYGGVQVSVFEAEDGMRYLESVA